MHTEHQTHLVSVSQFFLETNKPITQMSVKWRGHLTSKGCILKHFQNHAIAQLKYLERCTDPHNRFSLIGLTKEEVVSWHGAQSEVNNLHSSYK